MWYTFARLEWSHNKFTTVVEVARRGALTGPGLHSRCRWIEEKREVRQMQKAMPDSMKGPWRHQEHAQEIRMIDMRARSREEFAGYLEKFGSKGGLPLEKQRFQ